MNTTLPTSRVIFTENCFSSELEELLACTCTVEQLIELLTCTNAMQQVLKPTQRYHVSARLLHCRSRDWSDNYHKTG